MKIKKFGSELVETIVADLDKMKAARDRIVEKLIKGETDVDVFKTLMEQTDLIKNLFEENCKIGKALTGAKAKAKAKAKAAA